MPKEYIERGALIEKMFPIGMPNDGSYPINAKAVRVTIEKAPAADVVEVVRCKDCKYWRQVNEERFACWLLGFEMDYDEYCSYGKRKDNEIHKENQKG